MAVALVVVVMVVLIAVVVVVVVVVVAVGCGEHQLAASQWPRSVHRKTLVLRSKLQPARIITISKYASLPSCIFLPLSAPFPLDLFLVGSLPVTVFVTTVSSCFEERKISEPG